MKSCIIAIMLVIFQRRISASGEHTFQGFKVPCKDTSAHCMKESAQAIVSEFASGIPSLGIESLDPFKLEKVNLSMPGGLIIEFNEGQSKGLKKCVIDNARGKYRSHGKLFMFTLNGEGDATIVSKNLKLECSFKLGTSDRNGKKYVLLKHYNVNHSYQGRVFYKITNLFRGNPEISNVVLDFMNQNWLTVAEEFGGPIVDYGIQSIINNVNKLFKIVPADQILMLN